MSPVARTPHTTYAMVGDDHVAYQVFGSGPLDLLLLTGVAGQVDVRWDWPGYATLLRGLGSFSRVITLDRRGLGASDRPSRPLSWEDYVDDVLAVLDAVGSARCSVVSVMDGGPLALLLAATHPDRVDRMVLWGASARYTCDDGYDAGWDPEQQAAILETVRTSWGRDEVPYPFATTEAQRRFLRRLERASSSPAEAVERWERLLMRTDARHLLRSVNVPVLVAYTADDDIPFRPSRAATEYLVDNLPRATTIEAHGRMVHDEPGHAVDAIRDFLHGVSTPDDGDRYLATVLFVDVVGSTSLAQAVGDGPWRATLEAHDRALADTVAASGGRLVSTSGDGALAVFDGPARAVRCGLVLAAGGPDLLPVRVGVHAGEVEGRGSDVAGISVHVGARIAALGQAHEVLVSRTVRDLVAGSGLTFTPRGTFQLRGLDEPWDVWEAVG